MSEEVKTTFPISWQPMLFSDAVVGISTNKKKINQKQYLESGNYPVFDQGNNHIGGYTNDPDKIIYCDFPVIIFGDHTRAVKIAKEPFAAGADGVKVLQPKTFILPKLLRYFTIYLAISIKDKGYARHYQWVAKEEIGVPPENEQHRIVAKIEELFSELDKGIESLKRAREQLKVYRQALLKHAFEGKLTEQWRKDNADKLETADQLLARIKQAREDRYQEQLEDWKTMVKQWEADGKEDKRPIKPKGEKELPPISEEEISELPLLPKSWCWIRPQDVSSYEPYSIGIGPFGSNLKVSDYSDFGVPLVFVKNITRNNFTDELKYISEKKYLSLIPHTVKPLDILVTKMGDPPGDAEIYPEDRPIAVITADCLKFRIWSKFSSREYFKHCINSVLIKKQLGLITKGVAQKKISAGRFKTLLFPLPPIEEQKEIAYNIDSNMEELIRLEIDLKENLQRSEALRQSILKKAFSGQLVAQDPNDEPASVLLERIAAEKTQAAAQRKKPRANKKKPVMKKAG
ncbi:MAG: restriction endonuclease subunit S [Candidatus Thiodiazotropha endolucinida]|nr:restriction endonuclease subunit S [Candidatus Thiodiazotropha taylori]MCW4275610.1 restriction endonuclease subunit S [Candidatus Thiodiazotropha taylori]